jgi:hypothetical protein
MKISQIELDYCKSILDSASIEHLRGKIYFIAGTIGLTFMKREKFDFADIASINDFRKKTLTEINNEIKKMKIIKHDILKLPIDLGITLNGLKQMKHIKIRNYRVIDIYENRIVLDNSNGEIRDTFMSNIIEKINFLNA